MITYSDFASVRARHAGQKLVFVSGSYDLLHAGHVLFFETAKTFGDILVVAIGSDAALKLKGSDRPILNERLRSTMVDALKVVDYAFVHEKAPEGSDHDNVFLEKIFPDLKPDVWVVNTDASEIDYRKELASKYDIELIVEERSAPAEYEAVSTSGIIKKIRGE